MHLYEKMLLHKELLKRDLAETKAKAKAKAERELKKNYKYDIKFKKQSNLK